MCSDAQQTSRLLAHRRLTTSTKWNDPLLEAKSDPRVGSGTFCRKRHTQNCTAVSTVTHSPSSINSGSMPCLLSFAVSLWPPLHYIGNLLISGPLSVLYRWGCGAQRSCPANHLGYSILPERPRDLPHRVTAAPARSMDRQHHLVIRYLLLYAVVEAKRRLSGVYLC
jgi:hypothetical protein